MVAARVLSPAGCLAPQGLSAVHRDPLQLTLEREAGLCGEFDGCKDST